MIKLSWTAPKETKIIFPLFLNKFNIGQIYTNVINLDLNDYFLLFVDYDILIYKLNYVYPSQHTNKELSSNLEFVNKKNLDFISSEEDILYVKKDNFNSYSQSSSQYNEEDNFVNLLICTNLGNIFTINFNLTDFYYEVVSKFNIRHNFIHVYEILFYENKNIIMTIDKHLFLFEVVNAKSSISNNSLIKNLLLRIEDHNEKIISSFLKPKFYIVIFSNKAIYLINFELDGGSEIIFQKEAQYHNLNFSGFVHNDIIYYLKDYNSFSIYHIYDRDNKFTIKLSARNQLNDLSFFKIKNVDENLIIISNEKETELYFINKKYKLIHRESILFEKSFFMFFKFGIVVVFVNLVNMSLKFKTGFYNTNSNTKDTNSIKENKKRNYLINNEYDLNLNEIENKFVKNKSQIEKIKFKLKKFDSNIKHLLVIMSKCKDKDKFEILKIRIKKKTNKILNSSFLISNNISNKDDDENNTSPKISNKYILKTTIYSYKIISIFIQNFGSYSLKVSFNLLFIKYLKNIFSERLLYLLKISKSIRDVNVCNDLLDLLKNLN